MKRTYLLLILLSFFGATARQISNGNNWYSIERFDKQHKYPAFILFHSESVTNENFLSSLKKIPELAMLDFRLTGVETGPDGRRHFRYQQVIGGIPVFGSMFIAHEYQGHIISCNGAVFEVQKLKSVAAITGDDALKALLKTQKNTRYFFEDPASDTWLQKATGNPAASFIPSPELMFIPSLLNEKYGESALVYSIALFASEPMWHKRFFIDAISSEILFTEDLIENSDVPGKANTKYSGVQNIITDSVQSGVYRLRESARGNGGGMQTMNMLKGTVYSTATDFFDTDNYWTNTNAAYDEVAGDVHFGTERTYDYFKTIFNRNSIDNNGMRLISYVHYSTNYINAFWNGYFMTYGDGGNGFLPLTTLDVCGHEITHGLTQKTAALVYSNESGALNESFSDIFGVSIDFFANTANANFRLGEQFGPGGSALRDMKDPKAYQNPSTYKGQYWISTKTDNGGVHYNSGVQNRWFYLLCKGDSGTNDLGRNYKVDSIGILKAARIAYTSLTQYLTPLSTYQDAAFYSIQAAADLFGECSFEVLQVKRAWYAVGVINNPDTTLQPAFRSSAVASCTAPFTVQFYNESQQAGSYFWDFGDGQTSTQKNPTHTYTVNGSFTIKLIAYNCIAGTTDSVIRSNYVVINPGASSCVLTNMPNNGNGITLTGCSGIIRDNGDTADYGNLVYSTRSIAPANTSVLKLTFTQFDFESGFDFLYLYDGPDTLSPLLGKYTGNVLPGNGVVYCKSGAVTFRMSTDYLVSGKGFEASWQCIQKASVDLMPTTAVERIFGRKYTSTELKAVSTIPVTILNKGTQPANATLLKYRLNGGSVNSVNVNAPSAQTSVSIGPFNFSDTALYKVDVWTEDARDAIHENDTLHIEIKQADNPVVSLPLIENFDGLQDVWYYSKANAVGGYSRIDYDNSTAKGRLRTNAGADIVSGLRSITLDRSDRHWLTDTLNATNYIIFTYNMSEVAKLPSPLLFRFQYAQHGDKMYDNDAAWVRGCDTCQWIKFYDLFLNKNAAGQVKVTPLMNLNYFLDSAHQYLSSSFQLRFGQQDQNSVINSQQYSGYTFDNFRFSTWNSGITSSSKPEEAEVSPNPGKGLFTVRCPGFLNTVKITDATGKLVFTAHYPGIEFAEIDISAMPAGIYFIQVTDETGHEFTNRLISY